MHSRLKDRLDRLEMSRATVASAEPHFMGAVNLMVLLIAGHLGGMTEQEPVMPAYGRALGYASASDLKSALGAKGDNPASEERTRRHGEAVDRLLALKGVSIDDGGGPVCDALKALFDELPEHVRRHPFGQKVGASLGEVVDMFL